MIELTFLKVFMLIKHLDKGFKFQEYACNRCHDVLMMSVNLNLIAILNINGADYYYIISRMGKSGTVNLLQNANLTEKSRKL